MSGPPLDSTAIGKNMTNGTMSTIDSIKVGTKSPAPIPLTRPTELPEQNENFHVPGELNPDPSSSESSTNKYNLSKDINYSISMKKKSDKKKNLRKHKKQDASDSPSKDYDLSNDSDYRLQ